MAARFQLRLVKRERLYVRKKRDQPFRVSGMCDDQLLYCVVGKPHPHRDLDRRQQLAGSRAERGESEDPIVLADQCLELATRVAGRAGAKDRGDGELRQ
jgi:hypothetical protein